MTLETELPRTCASCCSAARNRAIFFSGRPVAMLFLDMPRWQECDPNGTLRRLFILRMQECLRWFHSGCSRRPDIPSAMGYQGIWILEYIQKNSHLLHGTALFLKMLELWYEIKCQTLS